MSEPTINEQILQENLIDRIEKLNIGADDMVVLYTSAKSFQKVDQIREAIQPYFKKKGAECFVMQSTEIMRKVQDKVLFERVTKSEKILSKIRNLIIGEFFIRDDKDKKSQEWYKKFYKNVTEYIEFYFDKIER